MKKLYKVGKGLIIVGLAVGFVGCSEEKNEIKEVKNSIVQKISVSDNKVSMVVPMKTETGKEGFHIEIKLTNELKKVINFKNGMTLKPKYSTNYKLEKKGIVTIMRMSYKYEPVKEILLLDGKEVAKITFESKK